MMTARLAWLSLICLLLAVSSAQAASTGSVGIQVVPLMSGELVAVAVIPESSAAKAGLMPGDLLVRIDDLELHGSNFEHVARTVLPGASGSTLRLFWRRPGVAGTHSALLTRQPIDAENVPPSAIPAAGPR